MNKILFLCIMIFLSGCQSKTADATHSETAKQDSSLNPVLPKTAVTPEPSDSALTVFGNIEIYPYCILLPQKSYTPQISRKMYHTFARKSQPTQHDFIKLQGFQIDEDKQYSPRIFHERDKQEFEEVGLGIDTSYIDSTRHFYLIKGYAPNLPELKFFQLVWVKDFELVLYVAYDEKNQSEWEQYLPRIIEKGISCE